MKISTVSISGMHNVKNKKYDLQNLNYLHGHNGAGKSTVLSAIQLAILGYLPGTAKQTAAIFQHASAPTMKIRLDFDDGRYIERSWTQKPKGKSIETAVTGDFDEASILELIGNLDLPVFDFNELMNRTANKLKDWFIGFLPSASSDIDWKEELTSALGDLTITDGNLLGETLSEINSEVTTLEQTQLLNAALKDKQSSMKTELKRSESTIQSLIYYDEDDITGDAEFLDAQLQKCQDTITKLTAEKENVIKATQIIASNNKIKEQLAGIPTSDTDLADLKNQRDQIAAEITEVNNRISMIQTKTTKGTSVKCSLEAELKNVQNIIESSGICPYTSDTCAEIQSRMNNFNEKYSKLKEELAEVCDKLDTLQQALASSNSKLQLLYQNQNTVNLALNAKENNAERIQSLQQMIEEEPDISTLHDLEWYTTEINNLNQKISKITANKRYSSLIDKLTTEKYKIENTLEVYKCWIKLTDPNGLQTKLMEEPFNNLEEDMDKYLSVMFADKVSCHFNLEEKANSFSFGIMRGKNYIPYELLSSGEKTAYTLAMLLCIVYRASSPLKVLIIDDMLDHLDNERADYIFKTISQLKDMQVIIAGVKDSANAAEYTIEIG